MKKISIFLILGLHLIASEIEQQIYAKILQALFPQKKIIKLYTDDPKEHAYLELIPKVRLVSSPQKADILILDSSKSIMITKWCDKPILVERYHLIKKYKDCVLGGFFWQKGRPNIIFFHPSLQRLAIHLPHEFSDYIEESL